MPRPSFIVDPSGKTQKVGGALARRAVSPVGGGTARVVGAAGKAMGGLDKAGKWLLKGEGRYFLPMLISMVVNQQVRQAGETSMMGAEAEAMKGMGEAITPEASCPSTIGSRTTNWPIAPYS